MIITNNKFKSIEFIKLFIIFGLTICFVRQLRSHGHSSHSRRRRGCNPNIYC
jgi:hypothetical protein